MKPPGHRVSPRLGGVGMTRVRTTAVATLVLAAGVGRGDEDGWRTPARTQPAPLPVPVVKPDGPAWSPSRGEAATWAPARGDVVIPIPVVQEPAPTPRPTKLPERALPAPRQVPPAEPAKGAAPATLPSTLWGAGVWPADCGPVLEPVPKAYAADGVPIRHGTFGSPNLTLSRDYHVLDLIGAGLIADETNVVVPGEGPAADNYFAQAEYLLWWVRRGDIPVLATTAPQTFDPLGNFGFLGRPGTAALIGPGQFGTSQRSGFRVRAGGWFDDWWEGCGLDGSFFFLGRRTDSLAVGSDTVPVIARPFFAPNTDPRTGQIFGEFGEVVAGGGTAGSLRLDLSSRLWGADVNVRSCVCRTCDSRTEWFAGYRHLNLREELTITESIVAGPLDAPDPIGTRIAVTDSFAVRNQFHGGQVGYASGRRWGRLDVDVRASVALGVTHQELEIAGSQTRQRPGQGTPDVFAGGLLAVGPSLGTFTDNEFSVAPEVTVTAGYLVTPRLRLSVGYNFLYWTNVLRPGDQIDRVVDLSFVPNAPAVPFAAARPQPTLRSSDLWVQGLQFGLEYRW